MSRTFICMMLMASVSFGQDLKGGAVFHRESGTGPELLQPGGQVPRRPPPVDPASSNKVKGKSHKKLWIAVAVVAGGVATGLVLVDKRLHNEGAGILR